MTAPEIRAVLSWRVLAAGALLLVSACSFTEESLWPSLTGEAPTGSRAPARPAVAAAPVEPGSRAVAAQPQLGSSEFQPGGVTSGPVTGTFVGEKVGELRGEMTRLQGNISQHNRLLQELRSKIVQDSQRYHGTVAAINSRLQIGTTPGNPILVQQLNGAQAELARISANVGEMNKLATGVGSDSTMSAYLAETARSTFTISGAVDEDHRQLAILEDEVNRTAVLIDRLLKEVSDDVRRQSAYVATERGNLNLLTTGVKSGEIYGASLVNQAMAANAFPRSASAAPAADLASRRPLVTVRFDRPDVAYQQALYNAVSQVLERQPGATFDLVAVAPTAGGPARVALNTTQSRRLADGVLRSLVDMGLPADRVAVSGRTSDAARENEVHLYLR